MIYLLPDYDLCVTWSPLSSDETLRRPAAAKEEENEEEAEEEALTAP